MKEKGKGRQRKEGKKEKVEDAGEDEEQGGVWTEKFKSVMVLGS